MSMEKIRVGITGYGNLGKGVEYALENVEQSGLGERGFGSLFSYEVLNKRD